MRKHAKRCTRPALIALLILATIIEIGCRSLPGDAQRPDPTYAVAPASQGPLADFASAGTARLGSGKSGFILVDENDEILNWRLALIDSAQQSLDILTFLWTDDFGGQLQIGRLLQAADRGVRVRLLVDDFFFRRRDRDVAALEHHPNISIRIWNPGRRRALGRNLDYLVRLRELNHRMHNKVLIADNLVVISGGRNIADEYYGTSERFNFFDLDLLAVGPVVPPTSGMFDRYWNSSQAVSAENFYRRVSETDLPGVRDERRKQLEASPLRRVFALDPRSWNTLLASGVAELVPGKAEVIYDKPGERAPSQHTLVGLQRFFRQAEKEVLVTSPYLVPGDTFFAEARKLAERGVKMKIMTNSLGSTDATFVHAAYARTRVPMLEAGLDVFEMQYMAAMKADLDTPPVESQWVGLHAKAAVIDRRLVFVGSFNLGPRSKNLNTEMGLLVESPVLGEQLAEVLSEAMSPQNSWQLRLDTEGNLSWESSDGTLTRQPAQTSRRRIQSRFFGLFPLERHL